MDFLTFGHRDTDALRFENMDIAEELLSLTDGSACEQMRLSGRRSMGHCLGAPMSCLCSGNCFRRELPAGVVDGVGRVEDQLADGHNGIPVVDQAVEDGRQGLRRVQRSVVEQHDAPRLHLGCYAPAYRIRVVVLPVQGVPIGNDLKSLPIGLAWLAAVRGGMLSYFAPIRQYRMNCCAWWTC